MDSLRRISSVQEVIDKPQETFNQLVAARSQTGVEFSRYKQDCRKRALEMAHAENSTSTLRMASQLNQGSLGVSNIDVIKLADKYYNWLISIPNE